jgi:K+-sensing histidine kinase KdpD
MNESIHAVQTDDTAVKRKTTLFSAKSIAVTAVMVALMIGSQFVLSFFVGVEIVTLVLCVFCVAFGVLHGVVAAVAFALLRCLVFGFSPQVVVLYLVYYPLFAVAVGFYGRLINSALASGVEKNEENRLNRTKTLKGVAIFAGLLLIVCALTCSFTMLDNVITPLILGFGKNSRLIYFYNSLPAMTTQIICVAVSVALLFYPLWKIMYRAKESMRL